MLNPFNFLTRQARANKSKEDLLTQNFEAEKTKKEFSHAVTCGKMLIKLMAPFCEKCVDPNSEKGTNPSPSGKKLEITPEKFDALILELSQFCRALTLTIPILNNGSQDLQEEAIHLNSSLLELKRPLITWGMAHKDWESKNGPHTAHIYTTLTNSCYNEVAETLPKVLTSYRNFKAQVEILSE